MSFRTQLIGLVGVLLTLAMVTELVRRQMLRTGYSLLWLFTGLLALILVLWNDLVRILADVMGMQSPRSLLFVAGIVFALLILLEHSLTLSSLWRQNKSMAQDLALLEWKVAKLEAGMGHSHVSEPVMPQSESEPDQTLEEPIFEPT